MFDPVTRLTPVAVLADRSRDGTTLPTVCELEPHGVFLVTDSRRRLSSRLLDGYDLVVICGHGTVPYSAAERRALSSFVSRGGALVLAASAGEFEAGSELPAARLAANGVAREFGFEFLSAAAYPVDPRFDIRHLPTDDLELTPAGERVGLRVAETQLWFPAPLEVPRGATVLVRTKRGRLPVAARVRVGRGTVLVWGDSGVFANGWSGFAASLYLAAVAPKRRKPAERPPRSLDVPREDLVVGRITVRFSPLAKSRAPRVLELAQAVLREVRRGLSSPKMPKRYTIRLEPGCSMRSRGGDDDEHRLVLGAGLSDAGVVDALVRIHCQRVIYGWWGARRQFPFMLAADRHLRVRVLERLGFAEAADLREEALRGGSRIDYDSVYSQDIRQPRAMLRFFRDATAALGADALREVCGAMPKKTPFADLPGRVYSGLDGMAFYLARALGTRVYDWLEDGGHTVRRIPLEKPGSDEFRTAVAGALRRILADDAESPSVRVAAALDLADGLLTKKTAAGRLARSAGGKDPARALPAAVALARSRDERGLCALGRLAALEDGELAGPIALLAVSEAGDETACDRLVAAAEAAEDGRFRLAAGKALEGVADARADRFSFARTPGCRLTTWENGIRRVYAVVDKKRVAVVVAGPGWHARGHGAAVSRYYVYWVHAYGPYRRLGLARVCLERTLGHRLAKTCSETALHSMLDYFAHGLYRELGLTDTEEYRDYSKPPERANHRAPKGVRVRVARAEDAAAAHELILRVNEERPQILKRMTDWPGPDVAVVAEEGSKLIGVAGFRGGMLSELGVSKEIEKKDRREAVGLALLAAADRIHQTRGTKELTGHSWLWYGDASQCRLLGRAGYGSVKSSLVEQTGIRRLPQVFEEMRVLLEARLSEAKGLESWCGTISFEAGALSAALRIEGGRVRVVRPGPGRPTIRLRADEAVMARILRGRSTAFDELNQCRLDVRPALTGPARTLLCALFPDLGIV